MNLEDLAQAGLEQPDDVRVDAVPPRTLRAPVVEKALLECCSATQAASETTTGVHQGAGQACPRGRRLSYPDSPLMSCGKLQEWYHAAGLACGRHQPEAHFQTPGSALAHMAMSIFWAEGSLGYHPS